MQVRQGQNGEKMTIIESVSEFDHDEPNFKANK